MLSFMSGAIISFRVAWQVFCEVTKDNDVNLSRVLPQHSTFISESLGKPFKLVSCGRKPTVLSKSVIVFFCRDRQSLAMGRWWPRSRQR